jgi:hypothetical protein
MKNNLIRKILEELGKQPDLKNGVSISFLDNFKSQYKRSTVIGIIQNFNWFEHCYPEDQKIFLLTAFATLPFFLETKTKKYISFAETFDGTIERQSSNSDRDRISKLKYDILKGLHSNLGQLLSHTLVDNLTNPNWLEVLEKIYKDNI